MTFLVFALFHTIREPNFFLFFFLAVNGFANFLYQRFNKNIFIICLKLLCARASHQVFASFVTNITHKLCLTGESSFSSASNSYISVSETEKKKPWENKELQMLPIILQPFLHPNFRNDFYHVRPGLQTSNSSERNRSSSESNG